MKLSKTSTEWFKRMKKVKDDGSEPIDNLPEGFIFEENPLARE